MFKGLYMRVKDTFNIIWSNIIVYPTPSAKSSLSQNSIATTSTTTKIAKPTLNSLTSSVSSSPATSESLKIDVGSYTKSAFDLFSSIDINNWIYFIAGMIVGILCMQIYIRYSRRSNRGCCQLRSKLAQWGFMSL